MPISLLLQTSPILGYLTSQSLVERHTALAGPGVIQGVALTERRSVTFLDACVRIRGGLPPGTWSLKILKVRGVAGRTLMTLQPLAAAEDVQPNRVGTLAQST